MQEEGGGEGEQLGVYLFLCFMAEGFLRLCRLRALIHPRTRAPTQRLIHTEAGVHHVVLPASQRVAMPRDRDRTEPAALRAKIRTNDFTGQTSGHAAGFVQANFCALPKVRRGILLVVLRAVIRPFVHLGAVILVKRVVVGRFRAGTKGAWERFQ
ncbi:MAG: hypothetical protein ACPIOQ_25235, partial [Promethearchaeia archaeon]